MTNKVQRIANEYNDIIQEIKLEPLEFFADNPTKCIAFVSKLIALKKEEDHTILDEVAKENVINEILTIRKNKSSYNDTERLEEILRTVLGADDISTRVSNAIVESSKQTMKNAATEIGKQVATDEEIIQAQKTYLSKTIDTMTKNADVQNQLFSLTRQELEKKLSDTSHPLSIMQEAAYKVMLKILEDLDSEDANIRSNAIKNYATMFNNGKTLTIKDCNFGLQSQKNYLVNKMWGKK